MQVFGQIEIFELHTIQTTEIQTFDKYRTVDYHIMDRLICIELQEMLLWLDRV